MKQVLSEPPCMLQYAPFFVGMALSTSEEGKRFSFLQSFRSPSEDEKHKTFLA